MSLQEALAQEQLGSEPAEEAPPDPRVVRFQSPSADEAAQDQAFADIYSAYAGELAGFAGRMIGAHEAEDAVQQTFINAWRGLPNLINNGEAALRQWLYTITGNVVRNMVRNRNTGALGHTVAQDLESSGAANRSGNFIEPETHVEFKATIGVLNNVPPAYRRLMIMSVEGYSYDQMAEAENITVGAVKARLRRGREASWQMIAELNADSAAETDTLV